MADRTDTWAAALLQIVRAEGRLDEASDELLRFARTFEGNDQLREALLDASLPIERRLAVVDELLSGKALTVTTAAISFIVTAGRAHDLPAIVDRFAEMAAAEREHAVAEVRSAVPIDEETQRRLAEALAHATGKQIDVKVVIDEQIGRASCRERVYVLV